MSKLVPIVLACIFIFASFNTQNLTASLKGKKDGPWSAPQEKLEGATESIDFKTAIRPLLKKYCADCHSPGDMEGLEFLVDMTEADVVKHRSLFADVYDQMNSQAMPPKDFDQPTDRERKLVTDWIKKTLDLKQSDIDRISQYVVEVYEDKKETSGLAP